MTTDPIALIRERLTGRIEELELLVKAMTT